jgi:hypothetical protein
LIRRAFGDSSRVVLLEGTTEVVPFHVSFLPGFFPSWFVVMSEKFPASRKGREKRGTWRELSHIPFAS